jgi:putative membrane protein insertion efficiency factor
MKKILIYILKLYKNFISPNLERLFGNACRFTPTCSEYTITALEKYGTVRGLSLGLKRVAKCHPWGGSGFDPVPEVINK